MLHINQIKSEFLFIKNVENDKILCKVDGSSKIGSYNSIVRQIYANGFDFIKGDQMIFNVSDMINDTNIKNLRKLTYLLCLFHKITIMTSYLIDIMVGRFL